MAPQTTAPVNGGWYNTGGAGVNPTGAPQSATSGAQPNFLERMLPTAGGILGGLIGLPLNALDAVSGVGGTALDAALAGGGSTLGKLLENHLTGKGTGSAGSLIGAGAGGAIGQGAGEAVGAVGSGLLNSVGSKALTTGADMIQGQAAKGMLNDAEAAALQGKGITDLRQVPAVFNEVSGSNGMLPNMVKSTFANSNQGVDISGLDKVANNLAAENGNLDSTSIKQINSALNTAVNNSVPGDVTAVASKGANPLFTYEPGSLKNALPENTFTQTQKLEQLANTAYKKGFDPFTHQVTDPRNAGLYNVFKGMANHLENASFGGDNPIPLSQEMKTELLSSPQMANLTKINPKAATSYAQDIGNATNLQDLRPMQSLIVRANNAVSGTAAKEGAQAGTNAMATARSVGAPISLALNHPVTALGSLALASPAADRAGASVLTKLAAPLSSKTMNAVIAPGVSGALGVAAGNLKNDIAQPTGGSLLNTIPSGNNIEGSTMNPTTGLPSNNIFGSLLPGSGVSQAYEPLALQALYGMYDPALLNGTVETNAANAANNLTKVQSAAAQLPELQSLFNQAGGAQGPVGGLLSTLSAKLFGGAAGTYGQQAQQILSQISKNTGIPSDELIAPQLTQSPSSASSALTGIQSLLQALGAQGNSPSNSVLAPTQ